MNIFQKFFGMVRALCGNNEHPDPTIFLLIFRLMSIYSLVRVEGSNVVDEDVFDVLIEDSLLPETCENDKEKWMRLRESIVQKFTAPCERVATAPKNADGVLENLCGCIAAKAISFIKCEQCASTLVIEREKADGNIPAKKSLIDLRNYFNVLNYPSSGLYNIISILEKVISEEIGEYNLRTTTFFDICDRLNDIDFPPPVGCSLHSTEVMGYIIQYYLVLRMFISTKFYNSQIKDISKHKELRKMGKLTQGNKVPNLPAKEERAQAKAFSSKT